MRLNNIALLVISIFALVTVAANQPFVSVPDRISASLEGGEWCTEHVIGLEGECDSCNAILNEQGEITAWGRCDSTGTDWACDNYSGPICQECILGVEEECGGDLLVYDESDPGCAGTATRLSDACDRNHNPNAYSNYSDGSCPDDCPADPGPGDPADP